MHVLTSGNFLFESGIHWRPGVYYNSGLEPRSLSQILPVGLPDCWILNMGDFLTMWIYWPFRIIQGHWFWQKSNTRTSRPNKMIKNNNLGHILRHFRVSLGFLLKTALHLYSIYEFWGVSNVLDWRCWISEMRRPKANYSCNCGRTKHPTHTPTMLQTDCRRTDKRLSTAKPRFV